MERREYLKQLLINSQNHLIVIQHVHNLWVTSFSLIFETILFMHKWVRWNFIFWFYVSQEMVQAILMWQKEFYSMTNFHVVVQNNSSAQFTNFTLQIFSFLAQHKPSNDAASSPHQGDTSKIQLPSQVLGSFSHQHKALRIGHYLRGIQGLQNKINWHLIGRSISFVNRFKIFSYPMI